VTAEDRAASALVDEALTAIHKAFDTAEASEYLGESLSVADHQLRTAAQAVAADARPALVAAALLHDIGHVIDRDSSAALRRGEDIRHESTGAQWLARWFGPEVTEPVRLHVAAKRYLCAVDPDYYEILSPISKKTLAMQGGAMAGAELDAFRAGPYANDAAAVRGWDDTGKNPQAVVAPLSAYEDLLVALVLSAAHSR
jgi:gamma-butyrobetaine dioxygenase